MNIIQHEDLGIVEENFVSKFVLEDGKSITVSLNKKLLEADAEAYHSKYFNGLFTVRSMWDRLYLSMHGVTTKEYNEFVLRRRTT